MTAARDPERWTPPAAAAGTACLVAACVVGAGLGPLLALAGVGLLVLACWTRDGFLLLGPFPRHELVRISRRTRVHLWRTAFALLFAVPLVVYYAFVDAGELPRPQAMVVATGGFLFVGWHVFLISFSLVMTYLSYAAAEDREAKRLDFVLVTDLRGRELVFGKMLSRLAGLLAYPLVAVPMVLLLPILFGVDPALIVYATALAAVSLWSAGGISTLGSVLSPNKKASGTWTVKIAGPYFALTLAAAYLANYPAVWFWPGTPARVPRVSVGDAIEAVSIGNPITLIMSLAASGATDLRPVAAAFPAYAAFHLGVGLVCLLLAARWVRGVSGRLADGPPPPTAGARKPPPDVSDRPVLWKEVHFNPLLAQARRNPRGARLTGTILVWVPAAVCLAAAASDLGGHAESVRRVARFYLFLLGWMMIVAAARFGMETIPRERERDTLTCLLLTPVPADRIVRDKMLGVLRIFRGGILAVGVVGAAAAACGAVPWWVAPGLVLIVAVYAFEMVGLGTRIGAGYATVEAANKAFGLWFGGVTFALVAAGGLAFGLTGGPDSPVRFGLVGLVPPVALLAAGHVHLSPPADVPLWAAGMAAGLAAHAAVGWWLWGAAVRRFVRVCDPAADAPAIDTREKG